MEDVNGEGLYLTKIPVSTHVSLYHHLHRCIPYCAFYQLMTACAHVCAKQLIGTWPILYRCYKHRTGEPDHDYMCLFIACNQCCNCLGSSLQFHIVLS